MVITLFLNFTIYYSSLTELHPVFKKYIRINNKTTKMGIFILISDLNYKTNGYASAVQFRTLMPKHVLYFPGRS